MLAGCSTDIASLRQIYILSASYHPLSDEGNPASNPAQAEFLSYVRNITDSAGLEVRVGFFGICVHIPRPVESAADWECGSLEAIALKYDREAPGVDPLGLVRYMSRFSDEVEFYGLL